MIGMLRLGARMALAGGRTSVVALIVTTTAVAVGTAVMLFALSFEPALEARYANSAWRDSGTDDFMAPLTANSFLMANWHETYAGRPIGRTDVGEVGAQAPVPAGLPAWPRPGETYVSAALQQLIETRPASELGDRFGRVIGIIGPEALRSPNELAAVSGVEAWRIRLFQAVNISTLSGGSNLPPLGFVPTLLAVVAAVGALTPVVIFVATSTRLTATSRERRLALLRLVGASRGQTRLLAVGEAVCAMVPGALLGLALFFLARPLVAALEIDQGDWFIDAVFPPWWQLVLALVLVPLLGVVAALAGLRRLNVSPLGAVRQHRTRRAGPIRLIPLVVAATVFCFGLALSQGLYGRTSSSIIVIAAGFVGLIGGVAFAGPWFTAELGRLLGWIVRGPSGLLAARRLSDAPNSAFGAVSGVVMAVFVASAFSVVAGYTKANSQAQVGLPVADDRILASLFTVPLRMDGQAEMTDRVRATDGVTAVAAVREVSLAVGDPAKPEDQNVLRAWVADCRDVAATIDIVIDCSSDRAWIREGAQLDADQTLTLGQGMAIAGDALRDPIYPVPEELHGSFAIGSFGSDQSAYGLPDVILDPGLLKDEGNRFVVTSMVVALPGLATASVERVRTIIESASSGARVQTVQELAAASTGIMGELGRLVILGTLATLLMAGCSLAVSVAAGLLDRRRPLALLRMTGMPIHKLRSMVLLEAGGPLLVTAILSAVLGLVAGEAMLQSVARVPVPMPDLVIVPVLASGLIGAMLVVSATLPLLGRITATEATRFE